MRPQLHTPISISRPVRGGGTELPVARPLIDVQGKSNVTFTLSLISNTLGRLNSAAIIPILGQCR